MAFAKTCVLRICLMLLLVSIFDSNDRDITGAFDVRAPLSWDDCQLPGFSRAGSR